ncbi:hypothetical protein SDC9_77241 [bioreactor metagenome]|uniref:ABC transporter permease n=1 Tax=bioreactor metagenome TaxID=1076179 RepID=A0A644YS56_9ZZZZ
MAEPILFGTPLTLVFLYFILYSFLGWAMETTYCSILNGHFVARGFLFGPICPIYGAGALMMVFFFSRFTDNLVIFYLVATVTMSCWEYFVGWLLEVTTHIKYWDYSKHRFNLKGRISLFICLWWGVLAYLAVFYIHPAVIVIFDLIPVWMRYSLFGSVGTLLIVDAVTTIRKLALTAKVMARLEAVNSELKMQASLAKMELGERLEENLPPELLTRLETLIANRPKNSKEALALLRAKHNDLMEQAERYSRRFLSRYSTLNSQRFASILEEIKARGERLKDSIFLSKTDDKDIKQ